MAESSELVRIQESSWCPVPGLTPEEARSLEALGAQLSAADSESGEITSLIQCRYTTSGVWEVRVADAIGLIGVGSRAWPVDPKIDPAHLFYLLQHAHVLPRSSSQLAEMASGKSLWHLIFDWFLRCTETLVRSDLLKGYSTETRELPYIRGTLDTLSLSRGLLRGHTRVRCSYEEFTADIAVNRVLKSALLFGLGSGTLQFDAARRSRRLLARFSEVSTATASDLRVGIDRHTSRYRDPLLLAHHILRGILRELSVGTTRAWCFLWRTPDAVEAGIRDVLREGLSDVLTVDKKTRSYDSLSFTPDLAIGDVAIGDIKYSLDSGGWRRDDVYQLLAFAAAHRRSRALLVNFNLSAPQVISALVATTSLQRFCWRLDLPPLEAGEEFIKEVRTWLTSASTPQETYI